jgi:hypothetical protein
MPLGTGNQGTYTFARRETRIPMEVGVKIAGNRAPEEAETTFTENVSSRGARVWTMQRWKTNDQLTIATLPGSFRAKARVAYCEPVLEAGFAVGLEFTDAVGTWVVADCLGN